VLSAKSLVKNDTYTDYSSPVTITKNS